MNTITTAPPGRAAAPQQPALLRAKAAARIEGLLFETVLEQIYVNPGCTPLEVVYTFPLPSQAVFLGLQTQLGTQRCCGVILARPEAEATYEDALQGGDTPVMVELADDGLLTANLGNLAAGEELVVTLRWGQWLQLEHGRIRAVIPTVVAPRFGTPSLQPQQVPQHSLEAQYPLHVTLDVTGELAAAQVRCETHRVTTQLQGAQLRLALDTPAALDRNVVFTLQPASGAALALHGLDSHGGASQHVVLAALQLPTAPQRCSVMLKILVDCSGSMNGDSIASTRRALAHVVPQLDAADRVTFSRFGSSVAHDLATPRCADEATRRRLAHLVAATDASLGGTQMQAALESTFALPGTPEGADVLLITDAQVWETDAMVAAARRSGHRVFAIGVGSAPREGLLRQLAGATGGACEFATPGESLEQAVERTFSRIRQQPWRGLHCVWDVEPQDMRALPEAAFGGDTLLVEARFDPDPPRRVRLIARDAAGDRVELACSDVVASQDTALLARMQAARRLHEIDDVQAAAQLALDYQLLTRHTCCVVIHERSPGEKISASADLHVVPQMTAAGWGGLGTVSAWVPTGVAGGVCLPLVGAAYGVMAAQAPTFSRWRSSREPLRSAPVMRLDHGAPDVVPPRLDAARLVQAAQCVLDALATSDSPEALLQAVDQAAIPGELVAMVKALQSLGLTAFDTWLVLALWVMGRSEGGQLRWSGEPLPGLLSDHTRSCLQEALVALERELQPRLAPATSEPGLSGRLLRLLSRRRV